MDSQLVEIKNLAKEEIARRSETVEEVLTEHDDLPGGRRGLGLLAGGSPGDVCGDEPGFLVALEGVLGEHRSAPVGGNRPLRCEHSSGGDGGNVHSLGRNSLIDVF